MRAASVSSMKMIVRGRLIRPGMTRNRTATAVAMSPGHECLEALMAIRMAKIRRSRGKMVSPLPRERQGP